MTKSVYEILTDENDLGNVVLSDESGTETEFEQEATLTLDDQIYCILCPLDENGNATDAGYVFKADAENPDFVQLVSDEAVIDRVFALYEQLCEENN